MSNSSQNGVTIIAVLAVAAFGLWYVFGRGVSEDDLRAATAKAVRCDAQSVCISVKGSCGYQVAVNKQRASEYAGIVSRYDRSRGCDLVGEIAKPGPLYPACVQNECTLVEGEGGNRPSQRTAPRSYGN